MTWSKEQMQETVARLATGATASADDLRGVLASTDILMLAMAADEVRQARHGRTVTYVRVAEVRLPLTDGPLVLEPAAGEVRLIGAFEDHATRAADIRRVVDEAGSVPVSAYSLADLERASDTSGRSVAELCAALRDQGIAAVAEAPLDRLAAPEASLSAAITAGLAVARLTMATNTDVDGRVRLLGRLKAVGDAGLGGRSVAPLARTWNPAAPSTGYEDVKLIALTRLAVQTIPSVQIDWTLYGPKLAQVGLTMGADDLDAVPASDNAPDGRRRAPLEDVLRNIRAAAFTPAARDGLYRRIGT